MNRILKLSSVLMLMFAGAVSALAAAGPGYLDCDGTRYMRIPYVPDFDVPAGGSISVSAKVWLNAYGQYRGIICNRAHDGRRDNTSGFEIMGGYSSTQALSNNVNMHTGSWNGLGTPWCGQLPTGQWVHVTWVMDGAAGTSRMYVGSAIRDERVSANIRNYPLDPHSDILVGARYDLTDGSASTPASDSYWLGKIKDVRIFRKALSARELVDNQTYTVEQMADGLVAAYDFAEIDGAVVTDISGHGNHGVLVGFPNTSANFSVTLQQSEHGAVLAYNGSDAVSSGQSLAQGTRLTLDAVPSHGYRFKHFSVDGQAIDGNTMMVRGNCTISAVFERDTDAPEMSLVWNNGDDGSQYYRIPAICTAADGSLVALADKRYDSMGDLPNFISVVSRRSTDGGRTWSDAVTLAQCDRNTGAKYGDPSVVLDRNTGTLIALYVGDRGFWESTVDNPQRTYMSRSYDNGVTWEGPVDITPQIISSTWRGHFVASGHILQRANGQIMAVASVRVYNGTNEKIYLYVIATDDGGEHWRVVNPASQLPADGNGNEAMLAERADGSLIMSIRTPGHRRFARSTDGGVTWSAAEAVNDLVEPGCNGDIILYPSADGRERLIHTLPNNPLSRRDVTAFISYDGGYTWPYSKKLINVAGESAYSSLTVLPDGSVGCLLEEGGNAGMRLYFVRFTLDWLTDGADSDTQVRNPAFDNTLNCDGTRYMRIPHHAAFDVAAGGSMSVSVRAKLQDYSNYRGIMCNRYYSGNDQAQTSGFDIFTGTSSSQSVSNNVSVHKGVWNNLGHPYLNTLNAGVWTTITWVYDGTAGTSKMYLDGILKDTRTSDDIRNYPINPQADILVGARYALANGSACTVDNNYRMVGNIDDVRIYSRALTEQEVGLEGLRTVGPDTPGLIAAYDFSNVDGTSVPDISGHGHTGTLVGFPDPSDLQYCAPQGTTSAEGRTVGNMTISDSEGNTATIAGPGSGTNRGYCDRTATVFTTTAGSTVTLTPSGNTGEWMHSFLFVDYGRDGHFDADPALATVNGDLVSFTRRSIDGSTFYNSHGTAYNTGHQQNSEALPSFTIPSSLRPGRYRARYRLDWNNVDACSTLADAGTTQGRACVDFIIEVQAGADQHPLTLLTRGHGTAYVSDEDDFDFDEFTSLYRLNNGDMLSFERSYVLCVEPDQGYHIASVSIATGAYNDTFGPDDCDEEVGGRYVYCFLASGDTDISVDLVSDDAAVATVAADTVEGPVEVFDLAGRRVETSRITNGFYLLRQGDKVRKVFVRR